MVSFERVKDHDRLGRFQVFLSFEGSELFERMNKIDAQQLIENVDYMGEVGKLKGLCVVELRVT